MKLFGITSLLVCALSIVAICCIWRADLEAFTTMDIATTPPPPSHWTLPFPSRRADLYSIVFYGVVALSAFLASVTLFILALTRQPPPNNALQRTGIGGRVGSEFKP